MLLCLVLSMPYAICLMLQSRAIIKQACRLHQLPLSIRACASYGLHGALTRCCLPHTVIKKKKIRLEIVNASFPCLWTRFVCVCVVSLYTAYLALHTPVAIYTPDIHTPVAHYRQAGMPSVHYVSILPHTSAYVRIRQHTSAYAVKQVCRASTVYGPLCVCVCTYIHTRYLAVHTPVAYHRYAERPLFMDQVLFIFCLCGNLGGAPVG
jgi:hypothetical protein